MWQQLQLPLLDALCFVNNLSQQLQVDLTRTHGHWRQPRDSSKGCRAANPPANPHISENSCWPLGTHPVYAVDWACVNGFLQLLIRVHPLLHYTRTTEVILYVKRSEGTKQHSTAQDSTHSSSQRGTHGAHSDSMKLI